MNESPGWSVREMVPADFAISLELWRTTEGVGLSASDTPERLGSFLVRNPGLSAVALDAQQQIIGTVLAGDDGRRGFLYHLAVIPTFRRRGIAGALIEHSTSRLAARGIEKCNILVYANNTAGLDFWRRRGWQTRPDLELLQLPLEHAPH